MLFLESYHLVCIFFVVDDEAKCWKCVYREYKQNTIVTKLRILLGGSLNEIGHLGHNWRTSAPYTQSWIH